MGCNEVVHLHVNGWHLSDSIFVQSARQVAASWNINPMFFLWPRWASLLHDGLGTGASDVLAQAPGASLQG